MISGLIKCVDQQGGTSMRQRQSVVPVAKPPGVTLGEWIFPHVTNMQTLNLVSSLFETDVFSSLRVFGVGWMPSANRHSSHFPAIAAGCGMCFRRLVA